MDVEGLAFNSASFTKVVCVETLEHLLDPIAALAQFHRVLRPGGRLVVTYPLVSKNFMRRWWLGPKLTISEHLTEWTYDGLLGRVRDAGFAPERTEGIAFDFGWLLVLKHLHPKIARAMTAWQLKIRSVPRNSMFVAASFARMR